MSYAPSDAAGKGTARYPRQASNAMAARLAAFQQSASDDGSVPEPLRGGALPQPPGAIAMAAASDVRRDPANRRPVTAEAATVASAVEHEAVRQLHQADVARLTMMQAVQQKRLALAMAEAERAGEESEQEMAKATEKPAFASSFASQLAALQKEQAAQAAQLKELVNAKETLQEQLEAAQVAREAYAAQARAQAAAELRLRQGLSASGSPAYAADSPGYVAGSPALPGGTVMWRPELDDEEEEEEEEGKAGSPPKSNASPCQGLPPASPSKVWRPDLAEASVPVVADPKLMAKQPSSSGAWWGDARCCGIRGRDPAITDGERNPYDLTIIGNLLRHYRMMVDQAQSDHHRKATAID
jgi:chemotaxis protein histidine kinase CheA